MKAIVSFTVTFEVNHLEIDLPSDELPTRSEMEELLISDVLPEMVAYSAPSMLPPLFEPKDITIFQLERK